MTKRTCCPRCLKSVGSGISYSFYYSGFAGSLKFCPHCLLDWNTKLSEVPTDWKGEQDELKSGAQPRTTFQKKHYNTLRKCYAVGCVSLILNMSAASLGTSVFAYALHTVFIVVAVLCAITVLLKVSCPKCGGNLLRIMPLASYFNTLSEIRYCSFCAFDLRTTIKEWEDKPLPPPLPAATKFGKRKEW